MTDTQLILSEIRHLRNAIEEIRASQPKRAKPRRKASPTLADVEAYAKTRSRPDLARRFHAFYTEGRTTDEQWLNVAGKPIYNWKSTFIQWESRNKPDVIIPNNRSLWNE